MSFKPYVLRGLYEWCMENGTTPQIAVTVDSRCRVPLQFVKQGQIVLNIGAQAVGKLVMANDAIHFSARFAGVARDVYVPIDCISAFFARENNEGMGFEVNLLGEKQAAQEASVEKLDAVQDETKPVFAKPHLVRVK